MYLPLEYDFIPCFMECGMCVPLLMFLFDLPSNVGHNSLFDVILYDFSSNVRYVCPTNNLKTHYSKMNKLTFREKRLKCTFFVQKIHILKKLKCEI